MIILQKKLWNEKKRCIKVLIDEQWIFMEIIFSFLHQFSISRSSHKYLKHDDDEKTDDDDKEYDGLVVKSL
jgi:hypothetical protein